MDRHLRNVVTGFLHLLRDTLRIYCALFYGTRKFILCLFYAAINPLFYSTPQNSLFYGGRKLFYAPFFMVSRNSLFTAAENLSCAFFTAAEHSLFYGVLNELDRAAVQKTRQASPGLF